MSHVIITCICPDFTCRVPGHAMVPPPKVDPHDLADAGREAIPHLHAAVTELMKARAAWVSRGLPADNQFPLSLDRLAEGIVASTQDLRRWTNAAQVVAERRTTAAQS